MQLLLGFISRMLLANRGETSSQHHGIIPRETSDEIGTVFSDICWCPKIVILKERGNENLLHLDKDSYIKRVVLEKQAIMLGE